MKDPALKTAAALCVLLGGLCAATLFRHDRPRAGASAPEAQDEVLLRYRATDTAWKTQLGGAGQAAMTQTETTPAPVNPRPVTILTPADGDGPPPSLAPGYPEHESPAKSRWGAAMSMMLPVAPSDDAARTHTVVDGDTLAALAERYLGSEARAEEIYQANRDSLHDPTLLPIGVELKLPPRKGPAPPGAAPPAKKSPQAMVPVK
jgi:nucleoid-associated protein YgaU